MTQRPQYKRVKLISIKSAFVAALIGIILLSFSSAFAWNAAGHMMVAKIAYDRLNPRAKAEADRLIKIDIGPADSLASHDFINASHWPDDIKSSKTYPHFDKDHFIDYPFSPDGTPLPKDQPDPENIIKALNEDVQILKTSTDDKAKAQALRFLIHFVGDLHQPLHAVTRVTKALPNGDRGGNDFHIGLATPVTGRDGTPITTERLHGYWDGGIDTFPRSSPPDYLPPALNAIAGLADQMIKENPDSDAGWKTGGTFDFEGWAKESFQIGTHSVYEGLTENGKPSAEYNKASIAIVHRRIAWAGYRLAAVLNTIWPETK